MRQLPFSERIWIIRSIYEDGSDSVFRVWHEKVHEHFVFPEEKEVSDIIVDPDLYILMKSSIYELTPATANYEITPNPFTGKIDLLFKNPMEGRKIYITNTRGQLVFQDSAEPEDVRLDLSDLQQGIFLLIILTPDGKRYSSKIVKLNPR